MGIGPGDPAQISFSSKKCIENASVLIGANRMLEFAKEILYDLSVEDTYEEPEMICSYRTDEILEYILNTEEDTICVLYSGDIGFSSGAFALSRKLECEDVTCIWHGGMSSVHYLLNCCRIPWEEAYILSGHGRRELGADQIAFQVLRHRYTVLLPFDEDQVRDIAKILTGMERADIQMTVGNDLSYRSEEIYTLTCGEASESENDSVCQNLLSALSVVLFINETPIADPFVPGLPDDSFIRGDVPMTKRAPRCMILSSLRLGPKDILLDVGAGTGSVSVEAALLLKEGRVISIEQNPEGASLIRQNAVKFGACNITCIEGIAPSAIPGDVKYTHVFLGGTDGKMEETIETILKSQSGVIRFVASAITLETLGVFLRLKEEHPEYMNFELQSMQSGICRPLGNYHRWQEENTIYIASFDAEGELHEN